MGSETGNDTTLPCSLVMNDGHIITSLPSGGGFLVNNQGACQWHLAFQDSIRVTTPSNQTYVGSKIVMTEIITGGSYPYYTFDHIKQLGDCGSMEIDSVVVN